MSTVISISTERRYGVARVCRVWGVARAGIYRGRPAAMASPAPRRRPGPVGAMSDADLVEAIRQVLADSLFTARATARCGRGCAMPGCAPRRSACAD